MRAGTQIPALFLCHFDFSLYLCAKFETQQYEKETITYC